jgi:hypothetical protein
VCVCVCMYVCVYVREREHRVGEVEGVDSFYLSRSTGEERDLEHI